MNNSFKDFERKAKIEELKRKVVDGAYKVGRTIWDNKVAIGSAIVILTSAARTANKVANDAHDRKVRDRSTYDNRTGTWYETKHKLSNSEKLKIQDLMRTGLTKGEALRELNLLKR